MQTPAIQVSDAALSDYCRRWGIRELAVFGSALRDDFQADSDVDFLVRFEDRTRWSLWDMVTAEDELARIVGRPVDLVERNAVEQSENWIRRNEILRSAKVVYGG